MSTQEKLNQLHELRSEYAESMNKRIAEIDTILTPEIKELVDGINLKWEEATQNLTIEIAELEDEIKKDVLTAGKTIKSDHLMAVWNKGRVTWDGKLLDGMAKLIPQIEKARKVGEPTVSIREVK